MGIGGCFAKVLKNVYHKSSVQVNVQNYLTTPFYDNIGVNQGCVLSPNLFKLVISDLRKTFDDECRPASYMKKNINCLMFADDVVLTSETAEGLQRALHKLEAYIHSKKWLLKINCEKTKKIDIQQIRQIIKRKIHIRKGAAIKHQQLHLPGFNL